MPGGGTSFAALPLYDTDPNRSMVMTRKGKREPEDRDDTRRAGLR
jgi:hypothetical protein